jgi:hypothetical protein
VPTDAVNEPAAGEPLPLKPAAVAILLHALLLVLYLWPWHFDLSSLVCVASERQGRAGFEAISTPRGMGYDGQFYYRLAQQPPWARLPDRSDLDSPVRQVRILYPAMAWLLSTGDPTKLLFVLPLVNLLAIGLLALAGSLLARSRGLSPWWGVLLPFAVNAGLPLFRDLTDNLALAMLALLLVGWLCDWSPGSLFGLTLAALLTREVSLLPVAVLGALALVQGRWRVVAALTVAGVCWVGWVSYVGWLYGEWPLLSSAGNFGQPLQGFLDYWRATAEMSFRKCWTTRYFLLATLALPVGVFALLLCRRSIERSLLLLGALGVLLVVHAGPLIWCDYWAYARTLTILPLVVWLACIQARSPGLAVVGSGAGGITLLTLCRAFAG